MNDGLSPADIAAVQGGGFGGFGNEGLWLFAILALMGGGFGNWGNRGGGDRNATVGVFRGPRTLPHLNARTTRL